MALSRTLAAAGISLLAVAGAAACDDYDEELAVQAARNAAKLAQSQVSERRSAEATVPPTIAQSADVAAVKPQPAPAVRMIQQ